ncbi:MAG: hypothetical protein HY565_01240 [Candidatus Kerfeldbacteria bacterium]|nr:hypothetical protein [Candidatus Kerfeldbacteria bacterium]
MNLALWITILGLIVTLIGRWQIQPTALQKHGFLWGAVLLTVGAWLDHEPVLVSLELIIVIGCVLGFFAWPQRRKAIIIGTATLCIPVVVLLTGDTWSPIFILGLIGLVMAAFGFAWSSNRIQLAASGVIIPYNTLSWLVLGYQIAALFLLLNVIYFIFLLRAIIRLSRNSQR